MTKRCVNSTLPRSPVVKTHGWLICGDLTFMPKLLPTAVAFAQQEVWGKARICEVGACVREPQYGCHFSSATQVLRWYFCIDTETNI